MEIANVVHRPDLLEKAVMCFGANGGMRVISNCPKIVFDNL